MVKYMEKDNGLCIGLKWDETEEQIRKKLQIYPDLPYYHAIVYPSQVSDLSL